MGICLNCDWKEKYPNIPWPGFHLVEEMGWSREDVLNKLMYDQELDQYSMDGKEWHYGEAHVEPAPPPEPPPPPPPPKPWELNPEEWIEMPGPFGTLHYLKPKEESREEILAKLDEIRRLIEAFVVKG